MKNIAILGSTGSVGTQTLDVVDKYPRKFRVVALLANRKIELLRKQIKKFNPILVGVADREKASILKSKVDIPVYAGQSASMKIAAMPESDTLVNSLVGLSGIKATLEAIRHKKDIALANKETLVAAGQIVMREVKRNNVNLLPIDSEHSALFQCLKGEKKADIYKMIITCSGGALRDKTKKELQNVSVDDALAHKTWGMGRKITIDSATLMNKGFEIIEAMWLYDVPLEKIDVVIHPQSIIHSMIEYSDGSIMAQMSNPDMKLPIQYALAHPERLDCPMQRFDFTKELSFMKPDLGRFPCLGYALEAASTQGTMPAVMNSANDFMVGKFLNGICMFMDIPGIVRKVMNNHTVIGNPSLEDIEKSIGEATRMAAKFLSEKSQDAGKTAIQKYYNIESATVREKQLVLG